MKRSFQILYRAFSTLPRFELGNFAAWTPADETWCPERILEERKKVKGLVLKDKDGEYAPKFIRIARDLQKELEKKEYNRGPFGLNPDLMYNGKASPCFRTVNLLLEKAYKTSVAVEHGCSASNFSGYALYGPRGVGKSTALKLVSMLSGILLPNFASLFVDIASSDTQDYLDKNRAFSCVSWLRARLKEWPQIDLQNLTMVSELIRQAHYSGVAVGLFVDEAACGYNYSTWSEFHALVTSTLGRCVFMADSTGKLPLIVKGTERNEICATMGVSVPLPSLNGTKLGLLPFPALSTYEHYAHYLSTRKSSLWKKIKANKRRPAVELMHTYVGGRFRGFDAFSFDKLAPVDGMLRSFPSPSDPLYQVFQNLARQQASKSDSLVDFFRPPEVTKTQVITWLNKWYAEKKTTATASPNEQIENWVQMQRLSETAEPGMLTFACPYHYFLLMDRAKVFISFRMAQEDALGKFLQKLSPVDASVMSPFNFVYCTQNEAQVDMLRRNDMLKWMTWHAGDLDDGLKFVMLFVTPGYLDRLLEGAPEPNPIQREVKAMLDRLENSQNGAIETHLLLVHTPDVNFEKAVSVLTQFDERAKRLGRLPWYNTEKERDVQYVFNNLLRASSINTRDQYVTND